MPCYTRIESRPVTTALEWDEKRTDIGLLRLALEDMGFVVVINDKRLSATHPKYGLLTYDQGRMAQVYSGNNNLNVAEVRRSYQKRVVHQQAKKMGWRCPQPGTPAYAKNDWSVQK